MKILNLYAGIGGNRKLWGDEHEITAVELDEKVAANYQKFFPKDKVVVADAHEFLLQNFGGFDFVWSSPPCTTHTKMNVSNAITPYKDNTKQIATGGGIVPRYADMSLYQEIIFLRTFFKGMYVVENVIGYYEPLIAPQKRGKHYYWANFYIPEFDNGDRKMWGNGITLKDIADRRGINLDELQGIDKRKAVRNCVEPEMGKWILDAALNPYQPNVKLL